MTMTAAVYARRSTDQPGVADETRSVTRQIERARAYAVQHGWTVSDAYIFVDDGVSGAEFQTRPGFVRLMNALTPRAPFDVLIVSELSRLGREQLETGYALKQLSQAGVKVFSYLNSLCSGPPTSQLRLLDDREARPCGALSASMFCRPVRLSHEWIREAPAL